MSLFIFNHKIKQKDGHVIDRQMEGQNKHFIDALLGSIIILNF